MPHHPDDRPLIGPVRSPEVHCMTLNVRRPVPRQPTHPDAWERRRDAVLALVTSEAPTVLAVQEALPTQADDLTAGLGSGWEPVLAGRGARGGGEQVGLFLDRSRLDVVERRTWALSRTPHRPARGRGPRPSPGTPSEPSSTTARPASGSWPSPPTSTSPRRGPDSGPPNCSAGSSCSAACPPWSWPTGTAPPVPHHGEPWRRRGSRTAGGGPPGRWVSPTGRTRTTGVRALAAGGSTGCS